MIHFGRALSVLALLLIATAASSQSGQPVVVSEDDPPRLFIFPGRDNVRPELTTVEEGVRFDANGDGVRVGLAWTKPDSGDAFLTLDLNDNGKVDSGRELLGNTWRGPAGQLGVSLWRRRAADHTSFAAVGLVRGGVDHRHLLAPPPVDL